MIKLYSTQTGTGPDIVLLNGLAGSTHYYDHVVDDLAKLGYHVTRIDTLGFGKSLKVKTPDYSLASHVDALVYTLKDLHIKNAVVAGYSISCSLALALAEKAPSLVSRAVLFCPTFYSSEESADAFVYRTGNIPRWVLTGSFSKLLCNLMCSNPLLAIPTYQALGRSYPGKVRRDARLHTWDSFSQTMRAMALEYRPETDLETVVSPISIVYGENDTSVINSYIDSLEDVGDQTSVTRIANLTHQLPYQNSELWLSYVTKKLV